MTTKEVCDLFTPAAQNFFGREVYEQNTRHYDFKFASVIGERMLEQYRLWRDVYPPQDKPLPPDLRELLSTMAGPHGVAICKVFKIKKGIT